MRELSLHIMDMIENSIAAGASLIEIQVVENSGANRLEVRIRDNGRGIPAHLVEEVTDPFFTTRTTRRVGLGLSLLKEAAKRCNGDFSIRSQEGEGTEVRASFERDHVDLAPMGDVGGSLTTLIMGNPEVDLVYTHEMDGRVFRLDTREIQKELEEVPIHTPEVLLHLTEMIRGSIKELETGATGTGTRYEEIGTRKTGTEEIAPRSRT